MQTNENFILYFLKPFQQLGQNDYEHKKQTILLGILEAFKTFKNFQFQGSDPEQVKKVVKQHIKSKILDEDAVFNRLKSLILLRDRDRSTRENAVKIMKKLIKFTKKACPI